MKLNLLRFILFLCVVSGNLTWAGLHDSPLVKWKYQSGAPVRGTPTVKDAKIYFGNSAGEIHCLNRENAKLNWKKNLNSAIVSKPALVGKLLIVACRDSRIYALNSKNGNQEWVFEGGKPSAHVWGWDYHDSSPVVDGKIVYVGSGDNNIYALNISSGKLKWKYSTGDKIRGTVLIENGFAYVPSFDGKIYKLSAKSGDFFGVYETEGIQYYNKMHGWDRTSIITKPAISNGMVVIGSRDGGVYCYNVATREEKWRFTYGSSWVGSSPVIDKGKVFIGWSDSHRFSAIDLETGEELWSYNCEDRIFSTPVVGKSNVYVGSLNGKVYSFDKETGDVEWSYQTNGAVFSSPVLIGDTMYVGSDDGSLYAFENTVHQLKAVYQPEKKGSSALLVTEDVTPFLEGRGYQRLNASNLEKFLEDRIADHQTSVVVFAHSHLPQQVAGENADEGLLKRYMESGGRVVWLNLFPNYLLTDSDMNITGVDSSYAKDLLDVQFDVHDDIAEYYSNATAEGLEWGLPSGFLAPGSFIAANNGSVEPLALNEFGRVVAFRKPFGKESNGDFLLFHTWSFGPISQKNLEMVQTIAERNL